MLAHCKLLMFSVCASQAAARKAQPLWQQLGFQAKINERKKNVPILKEEQVQCGRIIRNDGEIMCSSLLGYESAKCIHP